MNLLLVAPKSGDGLAGLDVPEYDLPICAGRSEETAIRVIGPALLPEGDPPDDSLEFADRVAQAQDFYRRFA